jgi:hypothetical protein
MLHLFGFEKIGVVVGDLFFVDPEPIPGQESPERGVRLEVRLLEQGTAPGSIYAARPILVDKPIWRVDLLESVDGPPGSFDRTHHHPRFTGWEPGGREFVTELSRDPYPWVETALGDLQSLLAGAGVSADLVTEDDPRLVAAAAQEIVATIKSLMDRVHAGELAQQPVDDDLVSVRAGWL